jgi:hypothetical protein
MHITDTAYVHDKRHTSIRGKLMLSSFKSTVVACLVAAISLGAAAPAFAANEVQLTAGGSPLAGATLSSSSFDASATTPSGTESVRFYLDGTYLGKDTTLPYSWPITAASGSHELKVRVDGKTDYRAEAKFSVKTSTGSVPAPQPSTPPTTAPPVTTPAPTSPVTPPVVAPSAGVVKKVSTSTELETALKSATPGSTISLADGKYVGRFVAPTDGTKDNPISLVGSNKAILTTDSLSKGYGLNVTGDYWKVTGLSVTKSGKGIVLDGSVGSVITNVDVGNIGDEGVHFRKNSTDGTIMNSKVHDTGLDSPSYGEGVYIGSAKSNWSSIMGSSSIPDRSDRVTVKNNQIFNTTTEGVDIKEGTVGGTVTGNVFTNSGFSGANYGDSWVDVKGNNYVVSGNSGNGTLLDAFQVHQALVGWGNGNKFSNNTASGISGYLVSVQKGVTGTSVACQATTAKLGLSNVACS